jgi:DinB superfamily
MRAIPHVDAALVGFAGLDEGALARPWSFRDKPMSVRYALYRTLEDAQEALVEVATRPHAESRRILALAQQAFGDLRGLVLGLADDLLERAPREREWSVGDVLRHVLSVEQRYAIQTRWAVERADDDPIRIPADRLPSTEPAPIAVGVAELLAELASARAETNRTLGNVAAAAMTRPTQWVQYDIDVRFRLHRFGAHIVEHTVQCEKTLAALGGPVTEGRRIVRRLTAILGAIEGFDGLAEVRRLEARLLERWASVSAALA